jgi:methionyl-tRNA formyltransferase
MMWVDYTINQAGNNFTVQGDTPTEVMDKGLYKPGDVFVVNENGWLVKTDDLSLLIQKYQMKKVDKNTF